VSFRIFWGVIRDLLGSFRIVFDVDLSSVFIIGEPSHKI
jgi:hypothetical protein